MMTHWTACEHERKCEMYSRISGKWTFRSNIVTMVTCLHTKSFVYYMEPQ